MVQKNIIRTLTPSAKRSFFLFGPRQTGKSTFVQTLLNPEDLYITLLPQRTFLNYSRDPSLFREEIQAHHKQHEHFTCVVDEIQKLPALLDEVHDLIETLGIRFILTGSSARKLKRGAANLLAGRASTYHLYPCTFAELGNQFELEKALFAGCLPYIWANSLSLQDTLEFLESYSDVYLREEIQAESVVRQIGAFVRFIDIAANNDGEIVNYSNISRECGVSIKTVQEYYQILEDTFLAYRIDPWIRSVRKRSVSHPKFYLFDPGVTNALCHYLSHTQKLNPEVRGRRFEQFIVLQIIALNSYHHLGFELFFWRTNTGLEEIDLILVRAQKPVACIEIKSSPLIKNIDTHGLLSFKDEYPDSKVYLLSPIERPRLLDSGVHMMPWELFLTQELQTLAG